MNDLLIRCSSLSKIMTKSSGLTEKEEAELNQLILKNSKSKRRATLEDKRDFKPEFDLSPGAKTYIKSLVKQRVYDYDIEFDSKQTSKGDLCEEDSIELYNYVNHTEYTKNEVSKSNEFIKGTCDIDSEKPSLIVDIKTSWTKETFPATEEDIDLKGYEWQGRGYMMLYNRDNFELAFCLVSTPFQLLTYEKNMKLHYADDIEPELRVTSLSFKRCRDMESEIIYKVKEARKYAKWYESKIINKF